MNFELTERAKSYQERLLAFMDERIYPAEAVVRAADARSPATLTSTRRSSKSSRRRHVAADSGTSFTRTKSGARV